MYMTCMLSKFPDKLPVNWINLEQGTINTILTNLPDFMENQPVSVSEGFTEPQTYKIFRSHAMTEFSVNSFTLSMFI